MLVFGGYPLVDVIVEALTTPFINRQAPVCPMKEMWRLDPSSAVSWHWTRQALHDNSEAPPAVALHSAGSIRASSGRRLLAVFGGVGSMTIEAGSQFGGILSVERDETPRTYLYDIDQQSWDVPLSENQPPARAAAAAATHGNRLLVHGGCPVASLTPILHRDRISMVCVGDLLSDLWSFDGDVWTQVPAQSSPPL